jgi:hypothetical protein
MPRSGGRFSRYQVRPAERKVPGETVLTRISSPASSAERFLLTLVIAAFDAV